MSSHKKFLKSLTVTYQGWGDSPQTAHTDMLSVMDDANQSYQLGNLFVSDQFQIQNELDPGGGGGPGYLRPSDVYLPKWGDDDHDD